MTIKRALILGIGGQDGSYLAELLLEKGYQVHGLHRRSSVDNLVRVAHIKDKITLHQGDLCDPMSVNRVIEEVDPHELYNLADQDDVGWSYKLLSYNMDVTAAAVGKILEYVRRFNKSIRVFQPCSATMFGIAPPPQEETTFFAPQSPYACAKVAAHYLCQHYRREHGLFVSTGIMFNHDSPRRSSSYLLHRICDQARVIRHAQADHMTLGCLDMRVDIGYAKDYVLAMWQMLQLDVPNDFVISSGFAPTIKSWVGYAFRELGIINGNVEALIKLDPNFPRVGQQPQLFGDNSKAKRVLGWEPKTTPSMLIRFIMRGEDN